MVCQNLAKKISLLNAFMNEIKKVTDHTTDLEYCLKKEIIEWVYYYFICDFWVDYFFICDFYLLVLGCALWMLVECVKKILSSPVQLSAYVFRTA